LTHVLAFSVAVLFVVVFMGRSRCRSQQSTLWILTWQCNIILS